MDKKEKSSVVEAMCLKKKEYGFSYEEIAKRSGLPLGTVQKVLGGFTKSPRHETLAALAKVLLPDRYRTCGFGTGTKENPETSGESGKGLYAELGAKYRSEEEASLLRDGAPDYAGADPGGAAGGKRQGEYTAADRDALEGIRPPELIDGVIYDLAAPTFAHQAIAGEIYSRLRDYIRSRNGRCVPFMAAADVRLDRDEKTVVMPDVFVVCDPEKIVGLNGKYLDGAPDMIIEIVSPSTRSKDMGIKLEKYRKAGVREYWIVDYVKRKVIVWVFEEDPDVFLYGFDGEVPVNIYHGDCRIDFAEISRQIRFIKGWEN